MLLGKALVRLGKATEEEVSAGLALQKQGAAQNRLGEILVEQGIVNELDVIEALGDLYRIDVVPEVSDSMLDAELIRKLPVDWARGHHMLPIQWKQQVGVLTCDLSQVADQNDLSILLNTELIPVLTTRQQIEHCIQQCYFQQTDTPEDFIRDLARDMDEKADLQVTSETSHKDDQDLLRSVDSAPVTRLVNLILLEAVKNNASDIHLEPYEKTLRLRYRIDGMLYEQTAPPKNMEAALISRLKVMGHLDIAEKRLPQDGMTKVSIGNREMDIRISTIPVAEGERIVLRLLNTENLLHPLSDLGMPAMVLDRLSMLLQETRGAVWVTGPTGSGKTTTLYAALQALDTERRNVLTIEDPIEYKMPNIGQMAVKPKIGLTFSQGLRHILRQDPDVILVGETRDLETAEIAVRSSLTGHLVFSTLHTNDAIGAVVRLIDMGIPPYLVSAATKAVVAQRLLRTLCPHCAQATELDEKDHAALGRWAEPLKGARIFEGKGCNLCHDGYFGRTGIYELLMMDEGLRCIVRSGASLDRLSDYITQSKQPVLMDDAVEKILTGTTSVSEVLRVIGRL